MNVWEVYSGFCIIMLKLKHQITSIDAVQLEFCSDDIL